MKHSFWKQTKATVGRSHAWTLISLTAVSLAVHGMVLGLPVPEAKQDDVLTAPEPSAETGTVMEVALLPDRDLAPAAVESPAEPEPLPDKVMLPEAQEPIAAPERSISPRSTDPIPSVAESPPGLPPMDEPVAEPTPPSELPPDPLTELPPEPGSSDLSEPEPPPLPTLAEQLQDPTAYQYDGRKSLNQVAAATESMNWAVAGQTLPSKVDPMELPYQLANHCLDNAPVLGLLMVVVDAEGNFLRGPEVISSTGYRVLDEQAVEQVKQGDYVLPDRDAPKAYSVEVKVQYPESCP